MKKFSFVLGGLIIASFSLSFSQVTTSKCTISNKIHLEGDGGWDYLTVDDSASRLYISHGTIVQVVDLNDYKLIGTIPDTKGVHGIAVARDLGKGFISNGRDSSVTIFTLKTLEVTGKVKVTGANPDAILYDPFSKKVFCFNGRSANATVLDAVSGKVIGTIALPGKPEFSVTDKKGKVFVNIEDKSEICLIDPISLTIVQTWPIAPGEEPSGLAFDAINHRLFSVCGNKLMMVVDSDSGKVVAKVDIGDGTDGVAFDPDLKRAYSSNGEGTLTVVQEETKNTFKVLENFATLRGARTITVNPRTHMIYLPVAEYEPAPAATAENPRPRASVKPNSFIILEIASL
ncbi:MAG: YncE family protein [Bacteroidia bacterium]|nr:YncE family protein [Bacteroidia bacterium]